MSAEKTVRAWTAAIAAGDGAGACGLMTEHASWQLLERPGGENCEEAIRRIGRALGPQAGQLRALTVTVSHPEDDRAVATLGEHELGLERRDGRWFVADLMSAVRSGDDRPYPPPPLR